MQQPERVSAQNRFLRGFRFFARAVVAYGGDGVHRGVQALDPLDARFEKLDGRQLFGADTAAKLDCGGGEELRVCCHDGVSVRWRVRSVVCPRAGLPGEGQDGAAMKPAGR
jgi:hypothetical protein